ncbi:MAG: DUF192 domain-containing protein [Bacteriovoracia bacterium]
MRFYKITHRETGKLVATQVRKADNLATRLLGLMFKANLQDMDGLMLQPCNSIHTFFMRFPIDVVFLTANNEVVKVIRSLKPWRMTWMYLRAVKTLELKAGALPSEVLEGTSLEVTHV